jgi:hypothetical protein
VIIASDDQKPPRSQLARSARVSVVSSVDCTLLPEAREVSAIY